MGTTAWLRLVFSVGNVDSKSTEDAAVPRGKPRPGLLPPVAVADVKGRSGAGSLAVPPKAVPKHQEGWHGLQPMEGTRAEGCREQGRGRGDAGLALTGI